MENSQLIIVLRTFSKKEVREFRKWLQSPCHNQRSDVIALFEYLLAGDHLYNEKFLEKERLFRKIFPEETFQDAKLRQTIHFLFRVTEEFLVFSEYFEEDIGKKIALARIYRKRKINKLLEKNLQAIEELQESYPYRNDIFYRNEYLIQQEKYTAMEGKKRTTYMNLQEVSNALDRTFLIERLKQSCRMIFHQNVYKTEYENSLFDEILKFVEKNDLLEEPAIAIYYYVYKTITQKKEIEHFNHLKKEINRSGHLFPHHEIREIYLMAINYCIGRMNAGESQFIRECFELYRQGLKTEILIENKNISPWTFINIVLNGLRLGEYDWVNQFILSHQKFLDKPKKESIVHYSLARLHFEKKEYSKAMQLLVQSDFDDILINLNAKTMLMKIYYEIEEADALDSLLESMRTYILRKKVMGYHKSNYQNIIRYTKKLVKINPFQKEEKTHLLEEVQAANPLTEKQWIIEQLEAL